jgi:hypothetical protein
MSIPSSILLEFLGHGPVAYLVPGCPATLSLAGEVYRATNDLGDYDCLRSHADELIGFRFSVSGRERILRHPHVRGTPSVTVEGRVLTILLKAGAYVVDEVQASSFLYKAKHQRFLIGLHEWAPWGKIGFELGSFADVHSEH